MPRLKILTWHTHGNYLYYLTQAPHDFYVLSRPGHPAGYGGRSGALPWGDNVTALAADAAKDMQFDCILFQSGAQYFEDQYLYLSEAQRKLPRIYLEHGAPDEHPTDMRHPVDDPQVLLVHVTHFNRLMWDNGNLTTRVIEHGVMVPDDVAYSGELARGIVAVNHIAQRGRRAGSDIFQKMRRKIPLDLVGRGAHEAGGLRDIPHAQLPRFMAQYRFLFHPARYTGTGLAVIEAMMAGVPVVGLATAEMAIAIENGVSGYVDTDVDALAASMKELLQNPALAKKLGRGARRRALERFSIDRFVSDWDAAFRFVTG